MQRVRILFMGLLALFVFPLSALSSEYFFYNRRDDPGSANVRSSLPVWSGVSWVYNGDTIYGHSGYSSISLARAECIGEGVWSGFSIYPVLNYLPSVAPSGTRLPVQGNISKSEIESMYPSSCPSICDIADDDGDGICNSCDKKPGQPDDDDCVWYSSTNEQGQTVDLIVNEGCKQSTDGGTPNTLQHYRNDSAAPGGAKLTFDLAAIGQKFRPKTCDSSTGANDQGQCNCAYPAGNPLLAGMSYQGPTNITPETQKDLDDLKDLDDDNKLDNCDGHNSRCQDSCAKRGGVFSSFCRVDQMTGNIVSQCKCNDESGYTLVSPSPDTSTPLQDSDGDGIPDEFDNDHTGGTDNNNDGIDDNRADSYEAFK